MAATATKYSIKYSINLPFHSLNQSVGHYMFNTRVTKV